MGIKETLLYKKALGCLVGGLIGDAMGTPSENMTAKAIEEQLGWIDDFDSDGTDDTVMKNLLSDALMATEGYATFDDWAAVWLDKYNAIFGEKVGKFFQSVLHTAAKMRRHCVPRMAALGNMPSSSSAMCISPVGIVNACNPRAAAAQAYNIASLIHIHDVGFCQDGAAAMAAAVAAAFNQDATPGEIIESALEVIVPRSGAEIRALIQDCLSLARSEGDYKRFREALYREPGRFFKPIACDSRETVPLTLGLFQLAGGDLEKCVTYGANLGRDADTIASMAGAIAGAYQGVDAVKKSWLEKALRLSGRDQESLAEGLAELAVSKARQEDEARKRLLAVADGA